MNVQQRKLTGASVLFATATAILFLTDLATFDQWADFTQVVWGLYVAGNGIEHGAAAFKQQREHNEKIRTATND